MSARNLRLTMAGLVLLHLIVVWLHGVSHETWQAVFVGIVIFAGPLVALAALWALQPRVGTILLGISMAASSAFGICYHFLLSTTDNIFFVQNLGSGHRFTITAVLLSIIVMACCLGVCGS